LIYDHGSQNYEKVFKNQPKNCQIFASSLMKHAGFKKVFEISGSGGYLIFFEEPKMMIL